VGTLQAENIRADLYQYLIKTQVLVSAEFLDVLEDVTDLVRVIIQDGFREAIARLPNFVPGLVDRPFIELADAMVQHHIRLVQTPDRDLIRKSLLEAYIHAADPEHAFVPVGKTRLTRSLRQFGAAKFAALIFSLHLFNVTSQAIQDQLRADMPDARTFELYMLALEMICRDAVKTALDSEDTIVNKLWITALAKNVEMYVSQNVVRVGSA
jgi:hypothetical protein